MSSEKKYKILLLNHLWLKNELLDLGHQVVTAGYRGGFDVTFSWSCTLEELYECLPSDFVPDRIVYYDDSADPSILDIDKAPCPVVFLSIDIHHHFEWHKYFATFFSHTLVAQKDYINKLVEHIGDSTKVSWFPLWATQNLEPVAEKDISVSFRGTLREDLHPGRRAFFEQISKEIAVDFAEGPFSDVYTRSKIVLNDSVKGDVNFRVFEGMISGAMLMSPRIGNGLEELFVDGKEVILYEDGNVEDALNKLKYYLENDSEREKISEAGRRKVKEYHSLQRRAEQLIEILHAVPLNRVSPSFESKCMLFSHKMKILWVYLRKHRFLQIQDRINALLSNIEEEFSIQKGSSLDESSVVDGYLFTLDAINSDILDPVMYENWLNVLDEKFPDFELVKYLKTSNEIENGTPKFPEMKRRLRESRSTILNSFLSEY